jgi:glucose dehydrogenase
MRRLHLQATVFSCAALTMIRTFLLIPVLCVCAAAQVRYEDIVKGPAENWLTYAGTYQGSRYSTLKQIVVENAGSLVPKWVYHVPNANGLRTSPIVYGGVMYVTNSNSVYALDARSGRLIWDYVDARAQSRGVNRGAAILGNLVYITTAAGRTRIR